MVCTYEFVYLLLYASHLSIDNFAITLYQTKYSPSFMNLTKRAYFKDKHVQVQKQIIIQKCGFFF